MATPPAADLDLNVDLYSQALVREYLVQKGFRKALAALDEECPRTERTVTHRAQIAQTLQLGRIVKRNKAREVPFNSILEMITLSFLSPLPTPSGTLAEGSGSGSTVPPPPPAPRTADWGGSSGTSDGTHRAPISAPPAGDTAAQAPQHASVASGSARRPLPSVVPPAPAAVPKPSAMHSDLQVQDFDDDGESAAAPVPVRAAGGAAIATGTASASAARRRGPPLSTPLSPDEVRELRRLVTGGRPFRPEWRQGLYFSETPSLRFGLVQDRGGPCALLATLTAFTLRHLLASSSAPERIFQVGEEERQAALVRAMAEVVWRAAVAAQPAAVGGPNRARIVLSRAAGAGDVFAGLTVTEASSESEVAGIFQDNLPLFTAPRGDGVPLFLFSLLLSRGLATVRADGDDPQQSVIGDHGYAGLELFNLMVFGRAVTNVFDGDRVLADETHGSADEVVLKGTPARAPVGLLTLYEHFKSLEVGSNLKTPHYPIWVLNAESHFTVLFSLDAGVLQRESPAFDVYFYDQLASMDQVARLTIEPHPARVPDERTPSVIEQTLRTRWPGAAIDWNGSERIL